MNGNPRKLAHANLLLNSIWGLFSLALLLLVFYSTGQKEHIQTQEQLFYAADEVTDKLDNLINQLIQAVDSNLGHEFNTCDDKLLGEFQRITFNHLEISGVVIKDNHNKFLCGNLPSTVDVPIEPNKNVTLLGPKQISESNKPVFIIQQRLGDYYIQIFVLKEVFAEKLNTKDAIAQWVGLFDSNQNKMVLQIVHRGGGWKETVNTPPEANSNINNSNIIKMPLNLENFQVIVKSNPKVVQQFTWTHETMALMMMLLIIILIYFYLRHVISKHYSVHGSLLSAIKNNKFFPVYQPIFDAKTNTFSGAEVLLRWGSEGGEIIMPDLFIADAEQSGLIIPITLQLIEITFKECQHLIVTNANFHLAFNISAIHFSDHQFFDTFLALCSKYHIPSSQLMLEITERDLLRQDDLTLVMRMKELRSLGFSLAIDDFGTGHASISYLQHFPFNYLKIDQLFIRAIGTGAVTETLNQSIIHMAKNLKLSIIAEGVETIAQQEFLQKQDVHLMQGWYFAKAMPLEQLIQFIKGVRHERNE